MVTAGEYVNSGLGSEDIVHELQPIPFGIIPENGEVVVQQRQQKPWVNYVWAINQAPPVPAPATDLSARAKRRIRATWDIAVPTVAELCKWIEAHYAKRGDIGEWIWQTPRLLCRSAQRRFFPAWLATDQGYVNGHDGPAPHLLAEGPDHRRICEALRRGGANAFWKQAEHEDRKGAAERLLGIEAIKDAPEGATARDGRKFVRVYQERNFNALRLS